MSRFFLSIALLLGSLTTLQAQTFVDGIDVSHWQGNVDWNAVKNDGYDFAFVKATEGVNFVDSQYHNNMQNAAAAGVHVGPYHFCRIDSLNGVPFTTYDGSPFAVGSDPYIDAESEALDFLEAITPYYDTGLYLPPVADVEGLPDFGSTSLNRDFISNWVQIFSDTIEAELGRRPIIYTSLYGSGTHYTTAVSSTHDLWLAWWKGTGTTNPPVPADTPDWDPWQFWQYSATGSVAGISGNVDLDVFDGTMEELEQVLIGYSPGSEVVITDFEEDEGYFNWSTGYSGTNQGVGAASTATRVTTEAYEGVASQEIYIDGDAGGWLYRHLSAIGTPVANPASNLVLDAEGYIGFWLKTDDPGLTVQLAIDDPDTADLGFEQAVIADGEWHLYEWNLEDNSEWEAWVNEEGDITGPTITIDSILFRGEGETTFYMDYVAQNTEGSLAPLEGDFDDDGDVDADDLAYWQGEYANSISGSNFLEWQRNYGLTTAADAVAVPEPASLLLLSALGLVGMGIKRNVRCKIKD